MLKLQEVKTDLITAPIDVQLKKLEDYFMTDVISRSSVTMSKCVQAVLKQKQNKYYDGKEWKLVSRFFVLLSCKDCCSEYFVKILFVNKNILKIENLLITFYFDK